MAAALDEVLQDGLHDLNDPEYFSLDAVNRSFLWEMRRSPAHAHHKAVNGDADTPALLMGRALHTAVLEPQELDGRFAVRPEGINRRTKIGKAEWAAFEEANAHKSILPGAQDMATLKGVRDAIQAHPLAKRLCTGPGMTEKTALWTDDATGVRCKAKYDRVVSGGGGSAIVVDLKSTDDASPRGFGRSVYKFGYHFQAVHYLTGLDVVAGEMARRFVFVAVEKKPPHGIGIYELDFAYIEAARNEWGELLARYAKCKERNSWPSYPADIQILEAPEWVK
ncbi:MAG: PD-(D/E)XK nuclease-like domain-containing protein [Pseudomonadota bacterium]